MIEKYLVKKITEPVDWKITVPGSKSMTNRALLMAVLSAGTVRVEGVLFSDDLRQHYNKWNRLKAWKLRTIVPGSSYYL